MLDLVGMDLRERRKKVKLTLLTHNDGGSWSRGDASKIVAAINNEVTSHPRYPTFMIAQGEHTQEFLERALGHNHFTSKLVMGLDNPALPFRV